MNGKASFDDVYDQPDPRPYMHTLSAIEYQIPEHAQPVFRELVAHLRAQRGDVPLSVVDLCSSYGINPALLNHELSLADLYERYRSPELAAMSTEELVDADRAFYAAIRRSDAVRTVGMDVAGNAVGYAQRVGILDAASSENLEVHDPGPGLAGDLADVGLITVTGGIGYITESTFDRILACARSPRPPWVAAFVLRWVDMESVRKVLHSYGLTTERLDGVTFRQRRFADDAERDHAFAELRGLGIDPEGVETDGYHHTWLHLARPHEESRDRSVAEVLAAAL